MILIPCLRYCIRFAGRKGILVVSDATKGYWQIPLRSSDKEKTAFVAPKGLFHFTCTPFGLHGAAATSQRLMDQVLQPVKAFAAAYIDDF